jgi:hypothetical protein
MSNNLHLIKGDVEIFENAIKAAHGDEKKAKKNLSEATLKFARAISRHVFDKKSGESHLYHLENLDVTNGFEDEPVVVLTETKDCFAINKEGDIYSITSSNKYGFRRMSEKDLLSLPGEEIGFLHKVLHTLLGEVVIFPKK